MTTKLYSPLEVARFHEERMKKKNMRMTQYAEFLGVSKQHLYGVMTCRFNANELFGFEKVTMFKKINGAR